MLSNLLDNSYSAENVNKFQLDQPKTRRFCTKTDYLAPEPRYKTLLLTHERLIRAIPCGIASPRVPLSDKRISKVLPAT
ncbi:MULTISPECIES: hypothetical protein [unclassified Microcoleus]|uniref:hypothetical protein n=1 Tax=unclassified Microcoleus TaxID=2642155 RepID=UPI002FD22BCA